MKLFSAATFEIRPLADHELKSTLEVYKQCEDFLALGPVPFASMEMVQADIDHSKKENGVYCGIWNKDNKQIGVIDFIPEVEKGIAVLSLLMISKQYRYNGIGTAIVESLEAYLKMNYKTQIIQSGVQINNEPGIKFWKRRGFILENEAKDMGDGTTAFQMIKNS